MRSIKRIPSSFDSYGGIIIEETRLEIIPFDMKLDFIIEFPKNMTVQGRGVRFVVGT